MSDALCHRIALAVYAVLAPFDRIGALFVISFYQLAPRLARLNTADGSLLGAVVAVLGLEPWLGAIVTVPAAA